MAELDLKEKAVTAARVVGERVIAPTLRTTERFTTRFGEKLTGGEGFAVPTQAGIARLGLPVLYVGEKIGIKGKKITAEKLAKAIVDEPALQRGLTIPQVALKTKGALQYSGEALATYPERFFTGTKIGRQIAKVPIGIGPIPVTTLGKAVPYTTKVAPEVGAFVAAPATYAGVGVLSASEKLRVAEEGIVAKKIAEKEYERTIVPEGFVKPPKKEYIKEAVPIIQESQRQQALIEGGVSLAILGGVGAVKGYKAATKPLISYKSPIVKGSAMKGQLEVQATKGTYYKTYAYKSPVQKVTTTPFKKFLKIKPEVKTITRPQIYFTEAYVPTGAKFSIAKAGKISRVPEKLTKTELGKLALYGKPTPKVQYYLVGGKTKVLKVIPEQAITTTREGMVISKIVTKPKEIATISKIQTLTLKPAKVKVFAKKGVEFPTAREILKVSKVKYKPAKVYLDTYGSPTRLTRFTETPTFEGYKTFTFYKQPGKKVLKMKGLLFRQTTEQLPSAQFQILAKPGIKARLPGKIAPQAKQTKEILNKLLEVSKPKATTTPQALMQTTRQITETVQPVVKLFPKVPKAVIPKVVAKTTQVSAVDVALGVARAIKPKVKQAPAVKLVEKTIQEEKEITEQLVPTKTTTKEKVTTTQKVTPKITPVLITPIIITPRVTPRPPKPPTPPTTRIIPGPIPPPGTDKLISKLKQLQKQRKSVDIVTGMKVGRQKVIAKNLPPFKALKKASSYVDRNIEASFRLKVNPKPPKIKDISKFTPGRKFRPSKRDALYVVEHRKFRLDMPGEKKQIKQSPITKTKLRRL